MRILGAMLASAIIASAAGTSHGQSYGGALDTDDPYNDYKIRGVVMAAHEAEVSVDLSARIMQVGFEMGDRFEKGAMLIRYDCARLKAETRAARAQLKSANLALKNNRELFEHGASGELDVATAQADVERAAAELEARNAQIADCEIRAPYNGYIIERYVDPFETPSPGTPLLTIIDDGPLEIHLIAPSPWLRWLEREEDFKFQIDETGKTYDATIIRISRSIDSASQTVALVARFASPAEMTIAGMSGTAVFSIKSGY